MTQNIAIVGSGFLGMTLALRLAQSGAKVTLFESGAEVGGLASAWEIGNVVWDKHYHVTLASDKQTRKLVEELGLGDEYKWVETKTGFYTDGELVSMSDTKEFLQFPPLDLVSKLRLGGTIFLASRLKNWKKLEKITVEKWLTRLVRQKDIRKDMETAAQGKARRGLPGDLRRIYLGDDPADVRGPELGAQERDVWLRSRRLFPCA